MHHRLGVLRPQVGGHPRDVAGEGLLDGEVSDRAPFGVIRIQQPGPGHAGQCERQLPGQVVRVLHASAAAVAAVRRDHVRGVAGQEHPPVTEPVRAVRLGPPRRDVLDDDTDVRHADGSPQQFQRPLPGDPLGHGGPGADGNAAMTSGREVSPTRLTTRKPALPLRSSRKNPRISGFVT